MHHRRRDAGQLEHQVQIDFRSQWWTASAVLTLASVAFIVLFRETAIIAINTWYGTKTYNHGFMILPIVGYLIWERRALLSRLAPEANYWGLAAVALSAFGWLVGHIMTTVVVQQFALVMMVQALFLTVLGWRVVRHMAFPLFYLFFAVPFGDFLVPPLQDLTAHFVVLGLQIVGIPVFSDGIFISIPTGNFKVAEACAGVRFLIAMVALSVLCANMLYTRWSRRILFIGLGFIVPIIANGFRAFGIVMVAHLSDMTLAVGVDHILYGWLFFAIVMVILLSIGMTFNEIRERDKREQSKLDIVTAEGDPRPSITYRSLIAAGVTAIFVAASAPVFAAYADARTGSNVATLPKPESRKPWTRVAKPSGNWRPLFPTTSTDSLQSYTDGRRTVDLYIAYYSHQKQGAEVVNWENVVADDEVWSRSGSGNNEAVIDGAPAKVVYTRMLSGPRARLAWHWYWVDGQFTANPYIAKLLEARAKLFGGIPAAAAIVVATDYDETPAEAKAILSNFLEHLKPLAPYLSKVAGR